LRANLTAAGKSGNIQMYRISLALLWLGEGKSMPDIAKDIGVTVKTVFNWLKTFMYKGMGWVKGNHYKGRGAKSKLSKKQKKELYDMIVGGPEANGFCVWYMEYSNDKRTDCAEIQRFI
jgi:transposase